MYVTSRTKPARLALLNFQSLTIVHIRYRTSVYENWAQNQETSSIPLLVDAAIKGKSEDLSIIYRLSQLAGVVMTTRLPLCQELMFKI